jgi:hypothetical protein
LVIELAARAAEITTDVSSSQAHLAISAETVIAVHVPVDLEPHSIEGIGIGTIDIGLLGVRELAATTTKYALDIGIRQAHLAIGLEPLTAVHVALDSEPVSTESGGTARSGDIGIIGIRRELSARAVEIATDVSTT